MYQGHCASGWGKKSWKLFPGAEPLATGVRAQTLRPIVCTPTQVSARVLPSPLLIYKKQGKGGSKTLYPFTAQGGAWNMADQQLYQPKQLKSYGIAAFPAQRGVPDLKTQQVRPCTGG